MKTIKIFLASSSELRPERDALVLLFGSLNKLYNVRGITLDHVWWEDLSISMPKDKTKREQDLYNEELKKCEICVTMFWHGFGSYTVEEFNLAHNQLQNGQMLKKICVFFKSAKEEDIKDELKNFKKDYDKNYKHFYCTFENVDTLKLQFLLELERYLIDLIGENTFRTSQGLVYVGDDPVVTLGNIPFVYNNKGYTAREAEIKELRVVISKKQGELTEKKCKLEKLEERLKTNPEDKLILDLFEATKVDIMNNSSELQGIIDKKNKLENEFEDEQRFIVQTARRITEMRGEKSSERLKLAIEAFENGDAIRADVILEEALKEVNDILVVIKASKDTGLHLIDELILKTSVKMSNCSIDIINRIEETLAIYDQIETLADECNYDKKEHIKLLFNYQQFLHKYGRYDKALEVCLKLIQMCEEVFGINHISTATSYNNIGIIYIEKNNLDKALMFIQKALVYYKRVFGQEHPLSAQLYMHIGLIYDQLENFTKSIEYHQRALLVFEKVLGEKHIFTARAYYNIGNIFSKFGYYVDALNYYQKDLSICLEKLGKENSETASTYSSIGGVYFELAMYKKALENYQNGLDISMKVYGPNHPTTVALYNNIANVYSKQGQYSKALFQFLNLIDITKKLYGEEHPSTATIYNNIGVEYSNLYEYNKAHDYYLKSMKIREKVLGEKHMDTANSYNNVATNYLYLKDDSKARKYLYKALNIYNKLGVDNLFMATIYDNLGQVFLKLGHLKLALKYTLKTLSIREKEFGSEHQHNSIIYNNIAGIYNALGDQHKAIEFCKKAILIQEKTHGIDHPVTADLYHNIGHLYKLIGDLNNALVCFLKCLAAREKILGNKHQDTIGTYYDISSIYLKLGFKDKAMFYYLKTK